MARRTSRPAVAVQGRLLAITAELHAFRREVNWDQPLRLGISIGGRPFIRMWQQRGDRVGFDACPLEPEDFGEVGRIEIHDVTDRFDPGLRNAEIVEARIVQNRTGEPIGFALIRPEGKAFCLWMHDDKLVWGDQTVLEEAFAPEERAGFGAAL
jgi:hypothetical protein